MLLRSIFNKSAPEVVVGNQDHIFVEDNSASIVTNSSTVDHDGSLVFPGIGKIKALGKSLKDLRSEISTLIDELPNSENAFQIKLENTLSQNATINIAGIEGGVVKF